jgi:hypothetical protein
MECVTHAKDLATRLAVVAATANPPKIIKFTILPAGNSTPSMRYCASPY